MIRLRKWYWQWWQSALFWGNKNWQRQHCLISYFFHNWSRIEKIFWWWWGWSQSIWFCDNIAEVDLAELPEMNFPRQFSNSFSRLKSSWKLKDVNLVGVWLFCLPDFWVCSNGMSKNMIWRRKILISCLSAPVLVVAGSYRGEVAWESTFKTNLTRIFATHFF